jgi:hypothetical protein
MQGESPSARVSRPSSLRAGSGPRRAFRRTKGRLPGPPSRRVGRPADLFRAFSYFGPSASRQRSCRCLPACQATKSPLPCGLPATKSPLPCGLPATKLPEPCGRYSPSPYHGPASVCPVAPWIDRCAKLPILPRATRATSPENIFPNLMFSMLSYNFAPFQACVRSYGPPVFFL